jgi:protein-disulfide isomerase
VFATKAALAAREQEKYVEFHEMVMASRNVTETSVLNAAKELGLDLDLDKLRADMETPQVENHIKQTMELARALGNNGTPAFVIGDRLIPGAADFITLTKAVADARDGQQKSN